MLEHAGIDLIAMQQLTDSVKLWLPQAIACAFLFCFGACAGSFMNVVMYRLPQDLSVISPPSRCPRCGYRLKWYQNMPILGWLLLRGRCGACRGSVSVQYPLVELLVAMMFVCIYLVLYVSDGSAWPGSLSSVFWRSGGFDTTWPGYIVIAVLFCGLLTMTVIDARTFLIPIQIPVVMTVTALCGWLLLGVLEGDSLDRWPIPVPGRIAATATVGGWLGLAIGYVLLRAGHIRYSFSDYEDYVVEGETIADYPHARREMGPELLYLLFPAVGLVAGAGIAMLLPQLDPPSWIRVLSASGLGYLVGGGLVWLVRILGTLAFGKEAMGLGDVHLLAAVGAILGWIDPIAIFFIAPFFGLAWVLVAGGLGRFVHGLRRELPYGPHLAMATVILVLFRPWLIELGSIIAPGVIQGGVP